jgi:hypothetical protein
MNPSEVAALCVSLTAGKTKLEIMAQAVRNALAAYKNGGRP